MKIRSVGAELFHANRGTDTHDEANRRLSQFCEFALKRKKAVEAHLKYYLGMFMDRMSETTQNIRCHGRDSNQSPFGHKQETLQLDPSS